MKQEQGRPSGHVFQTLDTGHVSPAQRYSYWVEAQFRHIRMAAPSADQRRDFRARVTSLVDTAPEVHYVESDAFRATRTLYDTRTDPVDELALLLVLEGSFQARQGGYRALVGVSGDFYLYDSNYPQELEFSRSRLIQFNLSRQKLTAACGGRLPSPIVLSDALSRSGLAAMLRLHLSQFPHAYCHLTRQEHEVLQTATESLALSIIAAALARTTARSSTDRQRLEAAKRYIHLHLEDPELCIADIARQLGCARATLYRTFNADGLGIAAYIREQRLQKLHRLLRNPQEKRPLSVLAPLSGLYDIPNVSQLFKKRFGMTPSQLRQLETNSGPC